MKWIKASERLPPQDEWPELHYELDGVIADGQIYEDEDAGIIWFEHKKGGRYLQEDDLSRVTWLDESPATTTAGMEEVLQSFADNKSPVYSYNQVVQAMQRWAEIQCAERDREIAELVKGLEKIASGTYAFEMKTIAKQLLTKHKPTP